MAVAVEHADLGVGDRRGRGSSVASATTGTLSDPASSSVGAVIPSNWPGWYTQSSSAWHSRGMVGAAASRTGHSGLARNSSISSSVISRMSTSTATMAASLSPVASAASMRAIDPGG